MPIAVIPILEGSKRIRDKNLLLLDGQPMAFYVVQAAKQSQAFDEIWINAEDAFFEDWAEQLDVSFYQRPPQRGGSACTMSNISSECEEIRCPVHDHYLYDFVVNHDYADYFVQIHTTSPTLTSETIAKFVEEERDCLFSAHSRHVEAVMAGGTNFDMQAKLPTQELPPVTHLTWGLSGWDAKAFVQRYESGLCPTWADDGGLTLFLVDALEAIDVDNPDDLYLAEAVLKWRRTMGGTNYFVYDPAIKSIERDVVDLIKRDGVEKFELAGFNKTHYNLEEIINKLGDPPWTVPLLYTESDQVCLIAQNPGEGCRRHYHATKHEWWLVLEGEFEWDLGEGEKVRAGVGEVVTLPRGTPHKITCVSDGFGVRLACGGRDMEHIYV